MVIHTTSEGPNYQTRFTDGTHEAISDVAIEKGGGEHGFKPHSLFEAAVANCINISVRMCADQQAIPLENVAASVCIERPNPEALVFRYNVELEGQLTADQRQRLLHAADVCPVRTSLTKAISFEKR